ncbi:MAG TPA: hypothetical protein VGJ26_12085, partial [Pirellulales bacterium]
MKQRTIVAAGAAVLGIGRHRAGLRLIGGGVRAWHHRDIAGRPVHRRRVFSRLVRRAVGAPGIRMGGVKRRAAKRDHEHGGKPNSPN